jgi:transmembrane sensor
MSDVPLDKLTAAELARITDYTAGELPKDARAETASWIAAAPARQAVADALRTAETTYRTTIVSHTSIELRIDALLARIARPPLARPPQPASLFSQGKRTGNRGSTAVGRRIPWTGMIVGAIAGCLVIGTVLMRDRVAPAPASQRYHTAAGQRATVQLTPAVRMMLAPATDVIASVRRDNQGVSLSVTGEAYFVVTPNHRAPLIVRTGHTETRVLGTTFSVRRYVDDTHGRIVVFDGRVSVRDVPPQGRSVRSSPVIVSAGMLGTVDDSGHVAVAPRVDTDAYAAWTTGRLVFRDTPVRDALRDIGRAYDVDIRMTDSARATLPLTWAVSTSNRSLDSVLEGLGVLLDIHSVRTGRVVTIVPGRRAAPKSLTPPLPRSDESHYGR